MPNSLWTRSARLHPPTRTCCAKHTAATASPRQRFFDVGQVGLSDVERVVNDPDVGGARRDLAQHLHPFASQRLLIEGKAGAIAARVRETRNIAARDRIGDLHE